MADKKRLAQTRICELGPGLHDCFSAKITQQAVEALEVLQVHGLLTDMESRKLAHRTQKFMTRHGLYLHPTGFKMHEVREVEESAVSAKKKARKK